VDVVVWGGRSQPAHRRGEGVKSPPVSNVWVALMRVHMMGVKPIAKEMARTRSSMSPKGGLIVLGVTPVTAFMTFLVQPSSAMTCSLVRVVRGAE
jgi:hypothetical protein